MIFFNIVVLRNSELMGIYLEDVDFLSNRMILIVKKIKKSLLIIILKSKKSIEN